MWIGLAASGCALFALACLERSVATGFRIYLLTRILRTVWTTTIALTAAAIAAGVIDLAASPRRLDSAGCTARALVALVTAIAALGAMLPDWSEFTCAVASAVVVLWAAALLLAARGGSHPSND